MASCRWLLRPDEALCEGGDEAHFDEEADALAVRGLTRGVGMPVIPAKNSHGEQRPYEMYRFHTSGFPKSSVWNLACCASRVTAKLLDPLFVNYFTLS
jgi:hypothetical protein